MSQSQKLSRRSALQLMAATGAAGTVASAWPIGEAFSQKSMVCGAIYVGPKDDFGWNQGHAEELPRSRSSPMSGWSKRRMFLKPSRSRSRWKA